MWASLLPRSSENESKPEARSMLRFAALFLGELRDGLTMINMQSAFLIVSKNYTEKQAGILFFVFGMSQFLFQTPAGYLYDYTQQKILWLSSASIATTVLTLATATLAAPRGSNLGWMIVIKFVQGAVTSFIPPGLNSITQGIVGATGMTHQVAINEMMNHFGTAIIVLAGSLIGLLLYPHIGLLFIVSPIACAGVIYFLNQINPDDIDHQAARGLIKDGNNNNSNTTNREIETPGGPRVIQPSASGKNIRTQPSFNFGWSSIAGSAFSQSGAPKAETPFQVLRDPALMTFLLIVFLFHTSNGTVLPLVMQTVAIDSGRSGILLSGLCIIVAQIFMVASARVCGEYSGQYGRKTIFLVGLFSVPVRCLILTLLVHIRDNGHDSSNALNLVILSTQILDGVGAGVFGTMYVLVSSDLSAGTGRFSLTLGLTTAAASIGGTVSGYVGEALAEDFGYQRAFLILMFMSTVPALLYLLLMPETLVVANKKEVASGLQQIQEDEEDDDSSGKKYMELT